MLVSKKVEEVALSGRGILLISGDPKLPMNCDESVAKSSAKMKPGLLAASGGWELKKSRSVSESNRPDISVSKTNGGEFKEYTGSALICMTLPMFLDLWHNRRLACQTLETAITLLQTL